jgi:hypothetical protein
MPRCYNQDQLAVAVWELLGFSRYDLLLLEAGSWDREHFGNREEEEGSPLESATKQRQWRRDCGTSVCVCL